MQIKFLVETQHIVQVCGGLPYVVSAEMANAFFRLGIGIVGGCEAWGGMLAFYAGGLGSPGARFEAWVQTPGPYGLHRRGGVMKSYHRLLMGRSRSGHPSNIAGMPLSCSTTIFRKREPGVNRGNRQQASVF